MPKFRKKPVEIEAFQMTPERRECLDDWPSWLVEAHDADPKVLVYSPHALDDPESELSVKTNHGWVVVGPGDWIIRQIDGEIYPCKAELFAATYDDADAYTGTAADGGLTEKTLHNSDVDGARKNVPDIKVVGDGDMFALLCKASSQAEGWMKSTKAMQTPMGCVVQVTTQQRNLDGTYSVAEALTFVPGAVIVDDVNGGRKLGGMAEGNQPGAIGSARERFPETQSQYSDHV